MHPTALPSLSSQHVVPAKHWILPLALFTTSCVGRDFEESIWSFVGTVNAVDEEDASKEKRQQADLIHSRLAGWLAKSEERRAVVTLRRNNFLIWKVLITAAGEN